MLDPDLVGPHILPILRRRLLLQIDRLHGNPDVVGGATVHLGHPRTRRSSSDSSAPAAAVQPGGKAVSPGNGRCCPGFPGVPAGKTMTNQPPAPPWAPFPGRVTQH